MLASPTICREELRDRVDMVGQSHKPRNYILRAVRFARLDFHGRPWFELAHKVTENDKVTAPKRWVLQLLTIWYLIDKFSRPDLSADDRPILFLCVSSCGLSRFMMS